MSERHLMRNALSYMLKQFKDGRPEHVLFTSFNFSASFFENNVLPLLCGIPVDEIKVSSLERNTINRELVDIKTVVVCDRSAKPEPKGNLRYGLMTVGLKRGRFHPKIILMSGTLVDGRPGLWLSVASGNLTYSGWARHREVVGTTPVTQSHAAELKLLVEWLLKQANDKIALVISSEGDAQLVNEEGNIRQVLKNLLFCLEKHGQPDDQDSSLPSLHLALPAAVVANHQALLPALLDGQEWTDATIISPFWGGVSELLAQIKAIHYHFVPAMQPEGYAFPVVNPIDANAISYRRFIQDPERYTHAKVMLFSAPAMQVLCIGSANFTTAALLQGKGYLSNVEAMLRYRQDVDDSWSNFLVNLDRESSPEVDVDEDVPPLPPFEADVIYDWHRKQFFCRVKLESDADLSQLTLEVGVQRHEFSTCDTSEQIATISVRLRQPVRSYKLVFVSGKGSMVYVGLVTQLNAADDELDYSPRPRLDLMLAFLHGLVPGQRKGGHAGGGDGDGADPDGDDIADPDFDFFSFFLATDKLRSYHNDPRHSTENPFGTGFTGVPSLYRAVILQPDASAQAKIGRYVQLSELSHTIAFFEDMTRVSVSDRVKANLMKQEIEVEIQRLENEIAPLLETSPQWKAMFRDPMPSARTFLEWFRQALTIKQGTL